MTQEYKINNPQEVALTVSDNASKLEKAMGNDSTLQKLVEDISKMQNELATNPEEVRQNALKKVIGHLNMEKTKRQQALRDALYLIPTTSEVEDADPFSAALRVTGEMQAADRMAARKGAL